MSFENKAHRFMRNTGPARFLIPFAIVIIIMGVVMMTMFSGNMIETTGTVTKVEETYDTDNELVYDVYFRYQAKGKSYDNWFPELHEEYKTGDKIAVYYDEKNPEKISNTKNTKLWAFGMIGVGGLMLAYAVYSLVHSTKKSADLDRKAVEDMDNLDKQEEYQTRERSDEEIEYYCRFDEVMLKPGYIVEDADRNILLEGKMLKNNLIGPRTFAFINHTTGKTEEHEVGHTVTVTMNDEYFSRNATFKFDGKDIWDYLHELGIRIETDLHSKFPKAVYTATQYGNPLVRIENSSVYVHEEDEAEKTIALPASQFYYRFWTKEKDLSLPFLVIFALSESDQRIAE